MTKSDKEVYEEAIALANEPETSFVLRKSFQNWRNKMIGVRHMYDNFNPDPKHNGPVPEVVSKRTYALETDGEKMLNGDFEAIEEATEIHNNMNEAFKEAGYEIDTYDKFVEFQKTVMAQEDPNKYFAQMNQKVRKVIEEKQKKNENMKFIEIPESDYLEINSEMYRNVIGDQKSRRYMGMMRDFDAFTSEEHADLKENGRYYRVNLQHNRPGYANIKHGSNTTAYRNLERRQLEHGMQLKKSKVHSKMVGGLSIMVTLGVLGVKYMELGFRDWNEQKLTFAQRLSSLESDYFPTEQSIHDHFRMKEWFYRSYRTMYGEPPEDDDDDDDFDF